MSISRSIPSRAPESASVFERMRRLGGFLLGELRPKGPLLTWFNAITIPIMVLGAVLLFIRFTQGLGAVTNLSQQYPWGLWIGFDVITGVAFAGGAYVLTLMVYVLRIEKFHPIVRVTVLNGLLAYIFYAGALLLDLGRPWAVINPIIGNSFGVSSVLFLVAWHFMLYMLAALLEFSPAVAEWLGWRRVHKILNGLTLGAVIFGVTLSVLHQSGLGALFLMAKGKIHPLWYSEFIPVLFLVSSVFAGLSLVVFEGSISRRVFRLRMSPEHHAEHDSIVLSLARVSAGAMFVYLFLKVLDFVHGQHGAELLTPMGAWYLVEVIGFVLIPCLLFVQAVRRSSVRTAMVASVMALLGVLLNRLNVSIIAFKWYESARYVPSWQEIEITLAVISAEIWAFRWIVNRMPVVSPPPKWADEHQEAVLEYRPLEKEA